MSGAAMSSKRAREVIVKLYALIARETAGSEDCERLLLRALSEAGAGGKQHRRGAWASESRYRNSVGVAAMYFVVKWFLKPARIESALDAVTVRPDCLFASALRGLVRPFALPAHLVVEFESIDYVEHIAPKPHTEKQA